MSDNGAYPIWTMAVTSSQPNTNACLTVHSGRATAGFEKANWATPA